MFVWCFGLYEPVLLPSCLFTIIDLRSWIYHVKESVPEINVQTYNYGPL